MIEVPVVRSGRGVAVGGGVPVGVGGTSVHVGIGVKVDVAVAAGAGGVESLQARRSVARAIRGSREAKTRT
jgi:hypothetical protein